jgi:hypothetical protein
MTLATSTWALPLASNDVYVATEDIPLNAGAGPLIDVDFDPVSFGWGGDWDYLDRLENRLGANHSYPTDAAGRNWLDPDFDSASSSVGPWSSGPFPLQSGGINGIPGAPDILYGIGVLTNGQNLVNTYLFRNTFTLDAAAAAIPDWTINYITDDGGIFYINGTNVLAANMNPANFDPQGPLGPDTLTAAVGLETYTQGVLNLDDLLQVGLNHIAVEVHQISLSSSDAGLDFQLSPGLDLSGGFAYVDDVFGTASPNFADGAHQPAGGFSGGGLYVQVGGMGSFDGGNGVSGAWTQAFDLPLSATVHFSFRYRLAFNQGHESDEYGQVLFAVDGVLHGNGPSNSLAQFTGDGNAGVDDDTGWQLATFDLSLNAGPHSLALGAFNNKSTVNSEITETWFDEVEVSIFGGTGLGGVLENDTGTNLTSILDASPQNGSINLHADGTFTYTPAPNYYGNDIFSYHAHDGVDDSNIATVLVNVQSVNDRPLAVDDAYTTTEGQALAVIVANGVLINDSDVEMSALTAVLVSDVVGGTLNLSPNGSFSYQPDPGFSGADAFTYTANDGTDASTIATVSLDVQLFNDPPVVESDEYEVPKNGVLEVVLPVAPDAQDVFFTDFDTGIPAEFSGVTDLESVQGFSGLGTNGNVISGQFLRNATSGNPASGSTLTLANLPAHNSLDIEFLLAIIDSWEGGGGDGLAVILDGNVVFSESFHADPGSGSQSYTPPEGGLLSSGTDLGFSSGGAGFFDSVYDMGAEPALQHLYHTNSSVTIEWIAYGGDWSGGDDESWAIDNLRISVKQGEHVVPLGSSWRYLDTGANLLAGWKEPAYDDSAWASGPAELGYGDGDEATVVGFGGVATNKFITTYFRHAFTLMDLSLVLGADIGIKRDDGAAVYLNGSEVLRDNLPAGAAYDTPAGTTNVVNENLVVQHEIDETLLVTGINTLAVEVHQDEATSSDISLDLFLSLCRKTDVGVLGNDVDPEGVPLSAEVVSPPANGNLSLASDGTFTYTPSVNFEGFDSFDYRAFDGGLYGTGTVTILVMPSANNIPLTQPDPYSGVEDIPLVVPEASGVLVNDEDPDMDPITAVLVDAPLHGSVLLEPSGAFTYTPETNYYGVDGFTYVANDSLGNSPLGVVTINLDARNDVPYANSDSYIVDLDQLTSIPSGSGVLQNDGDVEGDPLSARLMLDVDLGTLGLGPDGAFDYTPPPGFAGLARFSYSAVDGMATSSVTEVQLVVNARPLAGSDAYAVVEDQWLTVPSASGLLVNDSDPEFSALTATLAGDVGSGTLTLHANGAFSYLPDLDFNGIDQFSYTVSDGLRDSLPATVVLSVEAVNDAPLAAQDRYVLSVGQSISVLPAESVLVNDSDVDSTNLVATLVTDALSGNLTLFPDGSFWYTPNPGLLGLDTFRYRVSDGALYSESVSVDLEVELPARSIVINEIMYHPTSEDDAEEYVELVNIGQSPIQLLDWKFTSGISFSFGDITVPPGGFVVVAADTNKFISTYGPVPSLAGPWVGRLGNQGERIRLEDNLGNESDDLSYGDEGDWALRRRGPNSRGHNGWIWLAEHDGGGAALELMNPEFSNKQGQNWQSGTVNAPTPGATNTAYTADGAPMILNVRHDPPIPTSSDDVTIRAELKDEFNYGLSALLFYRVSTLNPGSFISLSMDNNEGDTWSAVLPAHPDGTVMEFYLAADDGMTIRTWPGPTDAGGSQGANALYQVDDEVYAGSQPIYRIIMSVPEDDEFLREKFNTQSDALMNHTFIARHGSDVDVRYRSGNRVRGAGSRNRNPINLRVNLPRDKPWNGNSRFNLNTQFSYLQVAGMKLMKAGGVLAAVDAFPVQVRLNGVNRSNDNQPNRRYGSYVHLEALAADYLEAHFPEDSGGNLYKKRRPDVKWPFRNGNINSYLSDGWSKSSNSSGNDWGDLDNFMFVMNNASGPSYLDQVGRVVNVEQWIRWFALNTLLNNRETNLSSGTDDDYTMYRGLLDPRFVLVPHDLDTIFGLGDTATTPSDTLFPMIDSGFGGQAIPQLVPFMQEPAMVRMYYGVLKELVQTVFSEAQLEPFLDNGLGNDWVPQNIIDQMKDFMDVRRVHILDNIPSNLSATSSLQVVSGFPQTDDGGLSGLSGTIDSVHTYRVAVNGLDALIDPYNGTWSVPGDLILNPGLQAVIVEAFGEQDQLLDTETITVWVALSATNDVSGTLAANTVWSAAGGPYRVTGDILVPVGVTLTIEPGTTVYFADGRRITVQGRLLAEGTPSLRIQFAPEPGSGDTWDGAYFDQSQEDNRMTYLDMAYASKEAQSIQVDHSRLLVDHMTWSGTENRILDLDHPSLRVTDSFFPSLDASVAISGNGLSGSEYFILNGNIFEHPTGFIDVISFVDAHRPGPIVQVYSNVFYGATDDVLFLDGADAHIEGNVFTDVHTDNPARANSSNAITADNASDLMVVRNIFHDVDHALLLWNHSTANFENNTVVDAAVAAINFDEPDRAGVPGEGIEVDGVIFASNVSIFENPLSMNGETNPVIVVNRSVLPQVHHALGMENLDVDPRFAPAMNDFSLLPGSPAVGQGPNGFDMGARVPAGASIHGEPTPITWRSDARLHVAGPGIVAYKYSLDGGSFGVEFPVDNPVLLTGLSEGSHVVRAVGKNSAGLWQNETDAVESRTWSVDVAYAAILIHEVLADNRGVFDHEGTFPDYIELWNNGPSTVDLAGLQVSDESSTSDPFTFSPGTTIPPDGYLVLYAADPNGTSGIHLGFSLDNDGEGVFLFDAVAQGGGLLDSVSFGMQAPDTSIGRLKPDLEWSLNVATPGTANQRAATGNPSGLKINEWLANNQLVFEDDFLELFNPDPLPVELSGFFLTDDLAGVPTKHIIAPLSFIPGGGFVSFVSREGSGVRANHLDFNLSRLLDDLALLDAGTNVIDAVYYNAQGEDVSEGRITDGAPLFARFTLPTPGFSNTSTLSNEVALINGLRVTELMYHPAGDEDAEFIEIQNVGTQSVDLAGIVLEGGVDFEFSSGTLLPGAYTVLVLDPVAFQARYGTGIPLGGTYTRKLGNAGDHLRLEISSLNAGILDFNYLDTWYPATDGAGSSLSVVDASLPRSHWDLSPSWSASGLVGGTPGFDNAFYIDAGAAVNISLPTMPDIDGVVTYGSMVPGSVVLAWSQETGPAPVSFSVTNVPDTSVQFVLPGAHVLRFSASFSGIQVSDTVAVNVYDNYGSWTGRVFTAGASLAEMQDDPDHDLLSNLEEFFHGTDPNVGSVIPPIRWSHEGGHLVFRYNRVSFTDTNLLMHAAVSDNLVHWEPSPIDVEKTLLSDNGTLQEWMVRDLSPVQVAFRRYLRLVLREN